MLFLKLSHKPNFKTVVGDFHFYNWLVIVIMDTVELYILKIIERNHW
jgi:hypothetical protein